jgi:hypothetical protein
MQKKTGLLARRPYIRSIARHGAWVNEGRTLVGDAGFEPATSTV